jgi:circadian clock protein KaiB
MNAVRSPQVIFRFRLFVSGDTQNSISAVVNLTKICEAYVPDRYEIEVVDVLRDPKRALAEGIFMTPTLVKLVPQPSQKIVGTLSQTETILMTLGLGAAA